MVATPPLVPSLGPQLSNAIALHQKKNFHEARAIYQQILQSAPDCFDALQLLGALEVQCKNYEAALIKLNQAISIDPAFGACYANLGIALQELNRFDEAIQSFTKAISLDSKNVLLYVNQADSFRKMRRFDAPESPPQKPLSQRRSKHD